MEKHNNNARNRVVVCDGGQFIYQLVCFFHLLARVFLLVHSMAETVSAASRNRLTFCTVHGKHNNYEDKKCLSFFS